ncbi:hypothetical protein FrEUN1fDRAFT_6781 [Parafrankia sp. EUN1f]|nr:hypothetical protein FrEUN1fDRAFT_6781 [Parafrankia sp. EUN1f]
MGQPPSERNTNNARRAHGNLARKQKVASPQSTAEPDTYAAQPAVSQPSSKTGIYPGTSECRVG